jgi:ATP-binding cassette subfamily B protein/subfamily B ATP-binding cassette protein MsbA
LTEVFSGLRVVRAFRREKTEVRRFALRNHLAVRQDLLAWRWAHVVDGIWGIVLSAASTGLMIFGGFQVLSGALTAGDLMMFLFLIAAFFEPLAVLANNSTATQNDLAKLDRILDLFAEPLDMPATDVLPSIARDRVIGHLSLRDVGFRYPGSSRFVLRNINLEIPPGQIVGLVGLSGAGKTTLCNLIARFYDPTEGRIELDGMDLRKIDPGDYRKLLAVVEQDVFLFDGTVAENISYAARNASPRRIHAAACVARADEFIDQLPDAYDTVIGERGVRLSGGQRQRLAIARAVLADPRIMIWDEATSNLDGEHERHIHLNYRALARGRTCFVIAHRLSTIANADVIVVLEDGRLVESGSHRELIGASTRYRLMLQAQLTDHDTRQALDVAEDLLRTEWTSDLAAPGDEECAAENGSAAVATDDVQRGH